MNQSGGKGQLLDQVGRLQLPHGFIQRKNTGACKGNLGPGVISHSTIVHGAGYSGERLWYAALSPLEGGLG